jgi:hypothetical protein
MRNTDGAGERTIHVYTNVHSGRRNARDHTYASEPLPDHTDADRYRDPAQPDADPRGRVDAAPSDSDVDACPPDADPGSSNRDAQYARADEYAVRRHADPHAPLIQPRPGSVRLSVRWRSATHPGERRPLPGRHRKRPGPEQR